MAKSGSHVVVVGGTKGIGRAVADALGEKAVVWSRERGVDATDSESVRVAAERLLVQQGAPWGLVHCVGDFYEAPLLSTEPLEFGKLIASNLTSALLVTQAIVPSMLAAKCGRVVLFAAAGAGKHRAMSRAPAYFAIKAALVHLARSLAAECAPSSVTVNVVSPGLVVHEHSHEASQRRILPRVPMGRLGTTAELAGVVRWLLSEQSGYMTGEDITVDGGLQL